MYLVARPSKSFLFRRLARQLKSRRGVVGIDAASANFKNRRLFKTQRYVGIDRDRSALEQGLAKFRMSDTIGIVADLTQLSFLPEHSADVVVSTNTLDHLPVTLRPVVLDQLGRLVAPGGYFLGDLPQDENLGQCRSALARHCSRVHLRGYKNQISRWYESHYQNERGELVSHPHSKYLTVALMILEILTSFLPFGNSRVIIEGWGKDGSRNDFSLIKATQLNERLYQVDKR